ncbi:MAG: efflux RND transporter permease subunit [Calditrichia bacterium]
MQNSIDFILKNRLMMLVLGVVVIVAGYYSYMKLPIDAFPDVSPALVQVFTVYRRIGTGRG